MSIITIDSRPATITALNFGGQVAADASLPEAVASPNRRSFLKTVGAGTAVATTSGLIELGTGQQEAKAFAYEPYPKDDHRAAAQETPSRINRNLARPGLPAQGTATVNRLRTSLRQRLLLGTLLWILLSIGIAGWGLHTLFRDHVSRQFHAELRMHLNQLAAHLNFDAAGQPVITAALSDPRLTRPYAGLYWQVDRMPDTTTPAASGILRSRSLWDFVLKVPEDRPAQGEIHEHRLAGPDGQMLGMIERVLRPENSDGPALRLIVAANESLINEPLSELTRPLLLALGLLATALSGALIVQLRYGLRPLNRLRSELARLRDGRQAELRGDFPSEIQPLVPFSPGTRSAGSRIAPEEDMR